MLKGLAISPGYALGQLHCLRRISLENVESVAIIENGIESEIERFNSSIEISRNEINQLLEYPQIKASLEISNIFQAHLTLIDDPDLHKEVIKRIHERMIDIQSVVSEVIKDYSNFFKDLPDPQFQGKAIDIMDVGKRIIKNCKKRKPKNKAHNFSQEGIIIAAEDLTPSEIVGFNSEHVKGIVIEEGTPTSHASILARSFGIPTLIQVKGLMQKVQDEQFAIIDATKNKLLIEPDDSVKLKYLDNLKAFQEKQLLIRDSLYQASITTCGEKISLKANIGKTSDLDAVIANNASGIGLYRTELAYLTRRSFPTEDELYSSYLSVIKRLNGQSLTVRTIDIGGDKIPHLMDNSMERNPELGWRAIRMALDCEEVFITQLRAILRASVHAQENQIGILFPMISNIVELRKIKQLLNRLHKELVNSGVPISETIKIGIMVEIPSVAILAEKFAKEVDFMAIGSNDLIQYTLAVDRTNPKVSHLYQPANPAIIKLISHVVEVAQKYNIKISMCGEMAGDTRYTVLLLGLGLRELSMNPILIPSVKQIIRNISISDAKRLIAPLLELDTSEEVELALDEINDKLKVS